jgi:signal transduction histidine kinase
MIQSKEKQLLNIIRFTPAIIVLILSIFMVLFLYFEKKRTFHEEKKSIEEQFINENKEIIKDEVNRVYTFIKHLQETTENELKKNVKERVYEAHSLATNIYEKNKNTKTKEEIFELIKTALSGIRYNNGRGYFFMDDIYGNKLVHPIDTSIEGKNMLNFTDVKGYKLFETIVDTIKQKSERFDEYYWYKPNTNKQIGRKISFYKYFEPLNMAIGTGEYFDEFEKEIQKKALEYINLIRFGKAGYIFVISYDGVYLSHIRKNYLGKHYLENNDTKNIAKVIEDVIQIAKDGEGYYSYIQNKKPDTNEPTHKISFIKGLSNWNWMIGSGFYEDDVISRIEDRKRIIDEKFEEYIQNILIISFVIMIILLFISKYVSNFLEQKFRQYKQELSKKQTILHQQSKMASMGEMIGNIAHQWRQPLSTITTAATGMKLQKEFGEFNDEIFYDSVDKINASAQHLSKTIDDFRNFFSPNKTKTQFDLKNTFSTALDLISAQFNAKEIKIIKHIENIQLNTYENELIQALINILNNARDELIKLPNSIERLIFIDTYIEDGNVIIEIKDSAGGVPSDIIDRIFEPYFTTKHKSNGTGIGLYMTEEILVKHLKADIEVYNQKYKYNDKSYKGAVFKITIPQ